MNKSRPSQQKRQRERQRQERRTEKQARRQEIAAQKAGVPEKDWRKTIGMFAGSDFIKQLDAECAALREAERAAARAEPDE